MVEYERRRMEREEYGALRALAKLQSFSSYASLALGVLAASILVAFAPLPGPAKLAGLLICLLFGGVLYFFLRAQAQMIYILFDIARNSRASRERLEKMPAR
ncbi:MAG: hypothetical protein HY653_00590 [Acidobacteria bacterium]|nr:hypothetical protein [Acidobacteriota bacterium]